VETLAAGILGGQGRDERLAALREERMLLGGLLDDVELALRMVAAADLDGSWRSAAQRRYEARLAELGADLGRAWRQLDHALFDVQAAISRLTAAG